MMAYRQTNQLGCELLQAFGVDPATVESFTLSGDAFGWTRLSVVHVAEVKIGDKIVDFQQIAKDYELRPVES